MSSSSANSSPDTGDGGGGTMGIYPRPSVSAQHLQQHQTYPLPQQQQQQQQHTKRTRVLLSCAPCRGSKLKCDRATPCGQCTKRGRPDACAYAPRPEKPGRPAKSMAARLKRLEGMVRGMIDADGNPIIASADAPPGTTGPMGAGAPAAQGLTTPASPPPPPPPMDAGGIVVQGQRATNYVGATHFMAILDDIEDLKNYFEEDEDDDDEVNDPYENVGPTELIFSASGAVKDKEELLKLLPEKNVIDRLMNRYFHSNSPSQHILHRPTFSKQYHQFWQNPSEAPLEWIALLFMVTGLGVFFSKFQSPHELESDSPTPALDRFKQYRGAAGWALVWSRYLQPNFTTLQAFLLYVEAEFLVNRTHQMNCYMLSSVCIRLMLKMGLHRDPDKLPNISVYEGEMRRRLWHLAIQIDLLVSFYLGLPCMMHGIESDTLLPRHLMDSDFDETSTELPPARPMTDYTALTYPIHKAAITRAFGLVAQQAHALKIPPYSEVMRVDGILEETWKKVPEFMKVKPLGECVTDPPMQVIQRFGLAELYLKSRCVLHRRYLSEEGMPKKEHAYSRRACLEAALTLLEHQRTLHEACQPGALLASKGWFVSSLTINDFLLADMVVALVLQSEHYRPDGTGSDGNGDSGSAEWMSPGPLMPAKDELLRILQASGRIWTTMARSVPDCGKAAEVVRTLLGRVYAQLGTQGDGKDFVDVDANASLGSAQNPQQHQQQQQPHEQIHHPDSHQRQMNGNDGAEPMAGLTLHGNGTGTGTGTSIGTRASMASSVSPEVLNYSISPDYEMVDPDIGRVMESMQAQLGADPAWMVHSNGDYDWSQFDALTRAPADAIQPIPRTDQQQQQQQQQQQPDWFDTGSSNSAADGFEFLVGNIWAPAGPMSQS